MPRAIPDRVKLLHDPYHPPRLRRGDRAFCLLKDSDVIVKGWTAARISWPKCRPVDVPLGQPSILVDEELARAIRQESAAALEFWWGVSDFVVMRWRRALGVTRVNNAGSQRLIRAASDKGASRRRGKNLPAHEVERRRQTAIELNLGQYLRPGYNRGPWWTKEEMALLGVLQDEEVARQTGRSIAGVRHKRESLGRAKPSR